MIHLSYRKSEAVSQRGSNILEHAQLEIYVLGFSWYGFELSKLAVQIVVIFNKEEYPCNQLLLMFH